MKYFNSVVVAALLGVCMSCSSGDDAGISIFSHTYDFKDSQHGWDANYTNYPAETDVEADTIYGWKAEYTECPEYLGGQKSMMLSCNNVYGDVFMFLRKKLSGFQPNTSYTLVFEVELASNILKDQNVVLKAGASSVEPRKVIEGNVYTLNIDQGTPQSSGEDLIVLGEIGVASPINAFSSVTKSNADANSSLIIRSNSKGEMWLVAGTHSTYQGPITVYYKKISVVFSVSNQ